MSEDIAARLIYLGLLLASLGGWFFVEYRRRGSQLFRVALAWVLIFIAAMAGYGLWDDLRRDIRPEMRVAEGEVTVPQAEDGHYYLTLTISGQEVTFMADTGASSVVLTPADATRLGIDPDALVYLGQAMTANGVVRTATVRLIDVQLGPFADSTISAQVNEVAMDRSLLGMDYLGLFEVTIADGMMVLKR